MRGSAVGDFSGGGEPASVSMSACVCPTGSRRCQMEEVSDGCGAEEVSDKEVSVMERGALYSPDLWEKCV